MGMFGQGRRSIKYPSSYQSTNNPSSNTPNPENFMIKKVEQIGRVWVSLVNYPDATNFEGDKILVTGFDPRTKTVLDPHFSADVEIFARFKPTIDGWDMAKITAALY